MNICIFSYVHISKLRGGVERVTSTLVTEFKKRGHNVYMVSALAPIEDDALENNQFVLPSSFITSNAYDTNAIYITNLLEEKKIDIIINQSDIKNIFDLIIENHKKIPVVSCIHTDPLALLKAIKDNWDEWKMKEGQTFWFKYPYFLLRKIYQYHTRKKYISAKHREYYEKSDAIVLLSEKFKDSFIRISGIKEKSKLYAISNPNSFKNTLCTEFQKENTVLFVGRLDFQKRVDRLLKVWREIYTYFPNWKLKIIGNGKDKIYLENYSKKLKLRNVEFTGARNPEEDYKRASIFCMTSTCEGFGMVLTEALQYNVIPIAYKSFESIDDIIINEINGFLVKPFSTKLYVKTLSKLISDKKYRESVHINIKKDNIVEKFSVERIANQWEELFNKLTSLTTS